MSLDRRNKAVSSHGIDQLVIYKAEAFTGDRLLSRINGKHLRAGDDGDAVLIIPGLLLDSHLILAEV